MATRVTDKMPDNIELLGLIAVLWPGSRVIVCNRDLRDIAVSCWFSGFETNPWTNTWELMARWFADHQRILEHWRAPSRSSVWKSVTRASLETWRDMRGACSTSWSSIGTPLVWISRRPDVSCVLAASSRFASRSTPVRLDGGRTTSRTSNHCLRPSDDAESPWHRIQEVQQIQRVSLFRRRALGRR